MNPTGGATSEGWHEIQALFRCEFEYLATKVRGIVPAGVTETPEALAQGLVFHAMRAKWFELGFKWDQAAQDAVLEAGKYEGERQGKPISQSDFQAASSLFWSYVDHYMYMPKPGPVGIEYTIEPTQVVEGYTRTARLDDVSRYVEGGGALYIGECKTTSASIEKTVAYYEMSGQLMLQYLLWKKAENGEKKHGPISGIMLDIVKKGYGGEPPQFTRIAVPITETMIKWFEDTLSTVLFIRDAIQTVEAKWDYPVARNPTACMRLSANGYVSWCPLKDLCKHGRAASGNYTFANGKSLLSHVPGPGKEKMPWE